MSFRHDTEARGITTSNVPIGPSREEGYTVPKDSLSMDLPQTWLVEMPQIVTWQLRNILSRV